jgi:plasmid stabilization system protein ParE
MPTPRYHRTARADLERLWLALARHNVLAADRYLEGLHERARRYAERPGMGRQEPELEQRLEVPLGITLRSFLHRNHRCYYIPELGGIVILRILDVRQELDNALDAEC